MQNNEFLEKLEIYRSEIDAIDGEIMRLLAKRFKVVGQVGALKAEHELQGSYIRPAREAMMLRALLDSARAQGVPQSLVAGIWRLIIGSSTAHESPLNVVHLSDDLRASFAAAQYFSDAVPQFASNASDFWQGAHVNEHSIFVLPHDFYDKDLEHPLWLNMPPHLKVFAHLPFLLFEKNCSPLAGEQQNQGRMPTGDAWGRIYLAIANIKPEPTGNDISLFHDGTKLVKLNGFMQDYQESTYIGSYAKPYI